MALSQVQVIQSLAEALSWFEKELDWGASPAELNHLTGRIGELYTAMITRGQMALETNQRGYDVVSAENEKISVKTVTSSNHVSFNANTFDLVDRVVVLRVNIDDEEGVSVETLLDCPASEFAASAAATNGKLVFSTASKSRDKRPLESLQVSNEASRGNQTIRQYENGSIAVLVNGESQPMAKPLLREIADEAGVDLLNGSGGVKNTRQLGADIIKVLNAKKGL
jgi:pyruvate/2-oxoglutarate dehydrogenase complex dihydrolipoamide acyltransferase (E2) component